MNPVRNRGRTDDTILKRVRIIGFNKIGNDNSNLSASYF